MAQYAERRWCVRAVVVSGPWCHYCRLPAVSLGGRRHCVIGAQNGRTTKHDSWTIYHWVGKDNAYRCDGKKRRKGRVCGGSDDNGPSRECGTVPGCVVCARNGLMLKVACTGSPFVSPFFSAVDSAPKTRSNWKKDMHLPMTNQQRHRLVGEFASVVSTGQQRALEEKKGPNHRIVIATRKSCHSLTGRHQVAR